MVANERAGRASALTPSIAGRADALEAPPHAQTASFDVGGFTLVLSATSGAATLAVIAGQDRDIYHLDPETLEHWADATARLLGLTPAAGPSACAEFRAPFLVDVEGRAAIAFESVVGETRVAHRHLVMGQEGRVAVTPTSADLLCEMVGAARGAVRFAREGSATGS